MIDFGMTGKNKIIFPDVAVAFEQAHWVDDYFTRMMDFFVHTVILRRRDDSMITIPVSSRIWITCKKCAAVAAPSHHRPMPAWTVSVQAVIPLSSGSCPAAD